MSWFTKKRNRAQDGTWVCDCQECQEGAQLWVKVHFVPYRQGGTS